MRFVGRISLCTRALLVFVATSAGAAAAPTAYGQEREHILTVLSACMETYEVYQTYWDPGTSADDDTCWIPTVFGREQKIDVIDLLRYMRIGGRRFGNKLAHCIKDFLDNKDDRDADMNRSGDDWAVDHCIIRQDGRWVTWDFPFVLREARRIAERTVEETSTARLPASRTCFYTHGPLASSRQFFPSVFPVPLGVACHNGLFPPAWGYAVQD